MKRWRPRTRKAYLPWQIEGDGTEPVRSRAEVAEILGCTPGNVSALERRALAKIRAALETMGGE